MEKTTITFFLLVLCVRVEYMFGASVEDMRKPPRTVLGAVVGEHGNHPNEKGGKADTTKVAVTVAPDLVGPTPAALNPVINNLTAKEPHEKQGTSDINHILKNPPTTINHANQSNTQHQSSAQEANKDISSQVILYRTLLSKCSDVDNLKDFFKEQIFTICSNWTTSDQNITQVSGTNTTRALCTLYFNGFTTFCAKLKSLNRSLSDSHIDLNPSNDEMTFVDAAAICERLSKQINFVKGPFGCMEYCYNDKRFLLQCHLANYYFNYDFTSYEPVQEPEHEKTATKSSPKGFLPKTNDTNSPSAQENLHLPDVPGHSNGLKKTGESHEANPVDPPVQSTVARNSHPDQSVSEDKDNAAKNEDTLLEPPKNRKNEEMKEPPAPQEPLAPQKAPAPQEGEGNDDQGIFDDKDSMDQPEEEYPDQESPKKIDEEKSIAKPNQLEEDIPISEDDIDGESYFFSYFMVVCVLFVLGYVFYHNRTKVMALVIEGKRNKRQYRGRRPNSANYHKLDSNLEEAISSSCTKSKSNIIY